jgi:AcrR family transcriptional regulator
MWAHYMWSMSTYHHGDLPTALLQAAGHSLERGGPGALSLRDAARRAKVSHNAPYRHFKDREALLSALADEGFRMLGQRLREAGARQLGEAYGGFALEHPERFRLMFTGCRSPAAAKEAFELLKVAMAELPLPEAVAAAAWSLMHGLACLTLDGHLQGADLTRRILGAVRFAQRAA